MRNFRHLHLLSAHFVDKRVAGLLGGDSPNGFGRFVDLNYDGLLRAVCERHENLDSEAIKLTRICPNKNPIEDAVFYSVDMGLVFRKKRIGLRDLGYELVAGKWVCR